MTYAGTRRVTDRVFLLGLDYLYRETMKRHEQAELLQWAEAVAGTLGLAPADVPVDGYYTESPALSRYFRTIRALQATDATERPRVAADAAFHGLSTVLSSRIFGFTVGGDRLVPVARDALWAALAETPEWTLPAITAAAQRAADRHDDYSLVGLAARALDPVVLASLRESVVLYAGRFVGSALRPPQWKYEWSVDPELTRQAIRFVNEFNALLDEDLPEPGRGSAERYWHASESNTVRGRCVAIGSHPQTGFYHWAVTTNDAGELEVDEFWSRELWTTQRFQAERLSR